MIRLIRGTSLLEKVVKQFDQAVADLQVAYEQIEEKRQQTNEKARAKAERNQAREKAMREKHAEKEQAFYTGNVLAEGKLYSKESQLYAASQRALAVSRKISALVSA